MNPLVPEALSTNCATMNCVKIEDVEALQELLRNEGYNVHLAELKGATDETEIFLRIAACLPYGAAYISLHKKINLDALADMLYSGVWEEGKVALVITNANDLVENHINLMFGLLVNFTLVTSRLRNKGFKATGTMSFRGKITTFLVGTGPNFV